MVRWWWLIIAYFGGIVSIALMALCGSSSRADRAIEFALMNKKEAVDGKDSGICGGGAGSSS